MSTVKRYWSAIPPVGFLDDKKRADAWKTFDAHLTPDDIFEMQKIDADCNDCVFFQRGKMTKVGGLACFDGHCLKFDRPTKAWPMQYSGYECFRHRKEAQSPTADQ